jgi:hypothetical protein
MDNKKVFGCGSMYDNLTWIAFRYCSECECKDIPSECKKRRDGSRLQRAWVEI